MLFLNISLLPFPHYDSLVTFRHIFGLIVPNFFVFFLLPFVIMNQLIGSSVASIRVGVVLFSFHFSWKTSIVTSYSFLLRLFFTIHF